MMIKYASADSWTWDIDRLDGRLATLVKVSSRGLIGEDLRSLVKRAGESLADQVRRLEVFPDEELVHHIALGTTETVGCFFAGTPIQTDRGFKPIEQVRVGDTVLTHRNRFRRVTEIFSGDYSGTKTTIKVGCLPEPSVSTGNHPFWIVRRKNFGVSRRCACFLKGRGMTKADAVEKAVKESAEFVRADEVGVGDYVIVPIRPAIEAEAFDDDLAYMYGLYLSEGCKRRRYDRGRRDHLSPSGIVFSFSKENDTAVLDVVTRTAKAWNRSLSLQNSKTSDKGIRAALSKKSFTDGCLRLFGDGAHSKFIHPEVFAQSDGWKRRFLAAYFDGDGCVAKNRKQSRYNGGLRASTVSLNLALDLQRMLAGLGIPSTTTRCVNRQVNGCFGSRDGVIYELSVGSAYSRDLLEECERLGCVEHDDRQKQSHAQVGRDYMLLPVRSVINEQIAGETKYNFEVEEDHTFCTLVLSHNSNRNGDGFKAAACRRYHDTFRKHGRLYYDHKHDDPERSYGVIKLSYFNEPMGRVELIISPNTTKAAADRNRGLVDTRYLRAVDRNDGKTGGSMACIPDPEAPVLTAEGYRPIRDVKVGDLVYTHEKRWRRVTELKRRKYTGKSVRFKAKGLAAPVWLTAEHPMYSAVLSGEPALAGGQRPVQRWSERSESIGISGFDWQCAEHLSPGDRLCVAPVTSSPDGVGIECEDLAALLGIFTAEGSLSYNGEVASTVLLTVHVDDWAVTAVPELIRRMAPGVTVKLTPKKTSKFSMAISIFSSELAAWCERLVGRRCDTKQVPMQLFSSSERVKLQYAGRWLDGDGFCDGKGVHWSTSNRNLALQLRDLLLSCGIVASIYRIAHKSKRGMVETDQPGIEYTVNISNFDAHRLTDYSSKVVASPFVKSPTTDPPRSKSPCLYKTGTLYSYVISEVEEEELVDHMVYNFEVEEDHSYSLYGLASHNCSIDYDVCSNCHNKAASRRFYCTEDTCSRGGCKHNLTKVSEDGHVLHVDNPHPKWFDFSHVDKPADRTAFAFGRVGHHKQASLAHADTLSWKQAVSTGDRVRTALTKLADLEYALADDPFGPIDVGSLRAAEAIGCEVVVPVWARRQFGGDPRKTAALAAGMKTAFNRLLLDPEREPSPDPVRYYGTRCPDEREVTKQAAAAPFFLSNPTPPATADAACEALAVAQLGWCLAGHSGDDIDRRVEIIVRANRGV